MFCDNPIRIRNQYTGDWLYVNCRHCDSCKIADSNKKGVNLSAYLDGRFENMYLVTLTYTDEYLPYILEEADYVLRGEENIEILGEIEEDLICPYDFRKLRPAYTHKLHGVGVLWYDDVQRFLKRLRKYINKHYGRQEFKYFCVGEYGSRFFRPHFHLIFGFNGLCYEKFKDAVCENWKMCDWNKFWSEKGEFEGVKVIDPAGKGKGCAFYVASYVNCTDNRVGISQHKQFRQKTRRSKDLAFGTQFSLYEDFKEDVIRLANEDFSRKDFPLMYWCDTTKKDSVSFRLFSERYIHSLFYKFKGWNKISINDRISRAYSIVTYCEECERLGVSKSIDFVHFRSADLSFYRAFVRFKNEFGNIDVTDYVCLMDKVLRFYDIQLLKVQMLTSENMSWEDYVLSLIDTKVEINSQTSRRWEKKKYIRKGYKDSDWHKCKYWKDSVFRQIDEICPPLVYNELSFRKEKYKKRLLPKHLNDISNFLNP